LPKSHSFSVYCDRTSSTAPLQPDKNVAELVRLEASLRGIKGAWLKIKEARKIESKEYQLYLMILTFIPIIESIY